MEFDSIKIEETVFLPPETRRLVWKVFFESRCRGVTLDYHFPWLVDDGSLICLSLVNYASDLPETIGSLVIRKIKFEAVGTIGLVGLVCIDEKYRKRDLSNILLRNAKECAFRLSLVALLLWTTKPAVYEKSGFVVDDQELFGNVKSPIGEGKKSPHDSLNLNYKSKLANTWGVPPFSDEVIEFISENASVTACRSLDVFSLVAWSGNYYSIIDLIKTCFPVDWLINVPKDSDLIDFLQSKGFLLYLESGSIRMVFNISMPSSQNIPYIPFLQRI